jgi:hypothetical protein
VESIRVRTEYALRGRFATLRRVDDLARELEALRSVAYANV